MTPNGVSSPRSLPERMGRGGLPRFARALAGFARKRPLGATGGAIVAALIVLAVFAPWIAPKDPNFMHFDALLTGSGASHLLGTDRLGRDILSRLIYGGRVSLYVGIVGVALGGVAGIPLGMTSAYAGKRLDLIVQRVVDGLLSFPTLVLAIVVVAMLGPSINNVTATIALVTFPQISRVARAQALYARSGEYVEAARAIGATPYRILTRHILPNSLAPLIVLMTVQVAWAILVEASLSFLGLGAPPPTASWGRMLSDVRLVAQLAPWQAVFPGLAISITVYSINLLGDALRDYWDPRLR